MSQKVLKKVATSILRLQEVYQLSGLEMSKGNIRECLSYLLIFVLFNFYVISQNLLEDIIFCTLESVHVNNLMKASGYVPPYYKSF